MLNKPFRKLIAVCILTFPLACFADDTGNSLLAKIVTYTKGTMDALNQLPNFILAWTNPDSSETTAKIQGNFAKATQFLLKNNDTTVDLQQQLSKDYFGSSFNPAILPYVNDLTFSSLLGKPFITPDPRSRDGEPGPDSGYNYLKNASGLNIQHQIPNKNWKGSQENKQRYESYYSTISSVQTYNSYLLSQLYADQANGNSFSNQQKQLMQQASSSDWFAQVASENIGSVLRQLLMYNSQLYVVMLQMAQNQRELLAAQAVNNTLLIMGNQFTENMLLQKAAGEM